MRQDAIRFPVGIAVGCYRWDSRGLGWCGGVCPFCRLLLLLFCSGASGCGSGSHGRFGRFRHTATGKGKGNGSSSSRRSGTNGTDWRCVLFELGIKRHGVASQNGIHGQFALLFVLIRVETEQTATVGSAIELESKTLTIQFETPRLLARAAHGLHFVSMVRFNFRR
jgi:hypothetical protein